MVWVTDRSAGSKPGKSGAPSRAEREWEADQEFIRRVFPPARQGRAIREWRCGVMKQLALVLAAHGHRRVDGRTASFRTHAVRAEVLFPAFRQLRLLGFKLRSIRCFREEHWKALVRYWAREGRAASTINTRLSVLRIFGGWLGKPDLIPEVTDLGSVGLDPAVARRTSHATANRALAEDKREGAFQAAEKQWLRGGLMLRIADEFGLRRKEVTRFFPHRGDLGNAILLRGAKGGQLRRVPIRTPEQRALLDRIKELIPPCDAMGGREERSLIAAYKRLGKLVADVGMTKAATGSTLHGLRQGYINDRVLEETGAVASVIDPTSKLPRDRESMRKRRQIMREVGHRRADAVRGYYGRATPNRGDARK